MKLLSFGEVLFDVFLKKHCLGGAPLNLAAHITAQGCESAILSSAMTMNLYIAKQKNVMLFQR